MANQPEDPKSKTIKYTKEEWEAKGKELFGGNRMEWKFVCPQCGNVTTPNDFKKFKDQGATPDSAVQQCIGRYDEDHGCNWCAYGLFAGPSFITDVDKTGGQVGIFNFAESD